MATTDTSSQKRIVDQLSFGSKTAKRVGWEAFEFTVEAPHIVRVTNASYGFEKAGHSYLVGVEVRDGLPMPAECECKADRYNEEYDCKHKVALATVGGPTVLHAAMDVESSSAPFPEQTPEDVTSAEDPKTCPNGDPHCAGPDGEELSCFECFEMTGQS